MKNIVIKSVIVLSVLACVVCFATDSVFCQQIQSSSLPGTRSSAILAPGDEKWDDRFCDIGADYTVWKVLAVGSDVYIGGEFTTIGGAPMNHITKWNGRSYSSLGTGLTVTFPGMTIAPTPMEMIQHGSDLYVCGNFMLAGGDTVNGIAKWSGGHWYPLGSGADAVVVTIAIDGNYLYAGGDFRTIGGIAAHGIARYNLLTGVWQAMDPGVGNEYHGGVSSIAIKNGKVYVGGNFINIGETTVNNIAVWDTTYGWSSLLGGLTWSQVTVNAMVFIGNDLFVGGNFTLAGGNPANYLAKWDGAYWTAIGTGADWPVLDMLYDGTDLYLTGYFTTLNGTSATHIAKMNPVTYAVTPLGSGMYNGYPSSGSIMSITKSGNDIYAGGFFSKSDSVNAYYISRWNTATGKWYALGKGSSSSVFTISVRPDIPSTVYVAGQVSYPAGLFIQRIAKFDGENWDSVGSDVRYYIYSSVATSTDLYVGGQLFGIGGVSVNNIAKWNYASSSWSALGDGLTGGYYAYALALRGSDLFAGGDFTTAGGSSANNVAKWNGTSWSPLGSGVNSTVRAIAVTDSFVYVGGDFTTAGGMTANYIARWDGTTWSTLGSGSSNGVDAPVHAIAVSGNDVYVGGEFSFAGGVGANKIAKWNSATGTWSALSSGIDWYGGGIVNTIVTQNKNVYVGGMFVTAGGIDANHIALWNDSAAAWSALGSGVDNEVKTLALSPTGKLYAGGIFLNAGGRPSYRFAIYDASASSIPLPPVPTSPTNDSDCIALNPTLQWNAVAGASSYRVQVSTDSLFGSTAFDSSSVTDTTIGVTGLSPQTVYYWRVNATNSAGTGEWSVVVHFTTGAGVMLPPTHSSPANGITGIPSSTTVYWQKACGAQSYILQIAYDSLFTSLFFTGGGITRLSQDLIELPAATWHYWRLRSVNGTDTSAWSTYWKFRTWGGEPTPPTLVSPANDTTCYSLTPVLRWNAASGATSYRVQVATDLSFGAVVFDSSGITGTSVTTRRLLGLTLYYWRVYATNTYGSSDWSSVRHFTTRQEILLIPTLTSPTNGATEIPTVTSLAWTRPCGAQSFYLQLAYDSAFSSFIYNSGGITQTTYPLTELPTATWHYWRVRSVSGSDTSAWSPTWKFMTVGGTVTMYVQFATRWNLLSLPLTVTDNRKSTIYPSAISTAFGYNGSGYVTADSLRNGAGYWIKFSKIGIEPITGAARLRDTVAVQNGWNLIGSIASTIPVTAITSIPAGLITSSFYAYSNGYIETDSIVSGQAYWVKVSGSGSLILSTGTATASNRLRIVANGELPPPPPGELTSESPVPSTYLLEQNYPNPFNPSTVIHYQLSVNGYVSLKVYTMLGVEIATLINGMQDAGYKSVTFDASGLPSGVYYYRLQAGTFADVKKMILVR